MEGAGSCLWSSRADLVRVGHELSEAQTKLAYLRRYTEVDVAAKVAVLEATSEAGEAKIRAVVSDIVSVDCGLRNELRLSRNKF